MFGVPIIDFVNANEIKHFNLIQCESSAANRLPVRNVQVYGANVRINDERTSAWRRSPERSFCDSLVFSDQPLAYGQSVRIQFQSSTVYGWKGAASIGLTCHEPSLLAPSSDEEETGNALPPLTAPIGLCEQPGVWLCPLPVNCLNRLLHIIIQPNATGTELLIILTSEQQYTLLTSLPVQHPLWLIIDLFGQTHRVDIVKTINTDHICRQLLHISVDKTGTCVNTSSEVTGDIEIKSGDPNDPNPVKSLGTPVDDNLGKKIQTDNDLVALEVHNVPHNVLSGGPKSFECFSNQCAEGAVLYNCVRLFLIGPSGSGKSTLRQQLIDTKDETNCSNVICRCFSNGSGSWQKELYQNLDQCDLDKDGNVSPFTPETNENTEEQAYQHLAFNLARLLLLQQAKDTALQSFPVARLLQLIRVDYNQSNNSSATEQPVPTSGNTISNALKSVIRMQIRVPKNTAENRFDDIGKSDSENQDENALPPKLRQLMEELLTKPDDLINPNDNLSQINPFPKEHYYEIWDLPGSFLYFMLNQTFLSDNSIYVFVVDVSSEFEFEHEANGSTWEENKAADDSPNGPTETIQSLKSESEMLKSLHVWLSALYTQLSDNRALDVQHTLLPKVILVASHRNSLHKQPLVRDVALKELFSQIRQSISGQPYESLLWPDYFAIDSKKMSIDEPQRLVDLRKTIDQVALDQKLLNTYIPISWLKLRRCLERLANRGIHFVARSQLLQLLSAHFDTDHPLLNSSVALHTALNFFQCTGKLIGFGPLVENDSFSDSYGPLWCQNKDCYCGHCTSGDYAGVTCTNSNKRNLSKNKFSYMDSFANDANALFNQNRCLDISDWLLVLQPHWLLGCCYRLCSLMVRLKNENKDAIISGVLPEHILDRCWADRLEQKHVLIGCLERLDLMCELRPYMGPDETVDVTNNMLQIKVYIFPWITQVIKEPTTEIELLYDMSQTNSLRLAITFEPLLPVGLYTRLVVRMCRWSWTQGWGRRPEINQSETRIAIDFDHDLVLKIDSKRQLIHLILIKIYEHLHNEMLDGPAFSGPTTNVCVKLRHLIECELNYLQTQYYRRISWNLMAICPCELECQQHKEVACEYEQCFHFLKLSDCLSKKVIECDYRQVRTTFVSRYFPHNLINAQILDLNASTDMHLGSMSQRQMSETLSSNGTHSEGAFAYLAHLFSGHRSAVPMNKSPQTSTGMSNSLSMPSVSTIAYNDHLVNWDTMFTPEPGWMREAAKQLHTISDPTRDWTALARRLGYSNREIRRLREDDTQLPAYGLLRDWLESNSRSSYCLDVLNSCLRLINRADVLRIVESEQASDNMAPPVFISYQNGSQAAALQLRRRLELSGFSCWMDVELTGGEQLFARIYDGLARCRLVICCLTARYCASRACVRELTLADALHKSILPLMLEPLSWPPPGPLAFILSPLLYVDLCGVGGHGGAGRRADRETRMREIVERVARYVSGYTHVPPLGHPLPLPDLFSQVQSQHELFSAHSDQTNVGGPLYGNRFGSASSQISGHSVNSRTTDTFEEINVESDENSVQVNAIDFANQLISHRSQLSPASVRQSAHVSAHPTTDTLIDNQSIHSDLQPVVSFTQTNHSDHVALSSSLPHSPVAHSSQNNVATGGPTTDEPSGTEELQATMSEVPRTNNRISNCLICRIS